MEGGPGSGTGGKPDGTHLPEDFVNTSKCDLCKCVYVNTAIATGLLTGPQKQYESLTVGGWAPGAGRSPASPTAASVLIAGGGDNTGNP